MISLNITTQRCLSRRTFLRAAGASVALPLMEAMRPSFAKAAAQEKIPRRMVAIETNMGIMPQFFFPEKAGSDYALTPYLQKLAAHRGQMTVFSGTSHPGVTGAHAAERCFLTATPHPERGGFRNGVSLDQVAAEQLGNETRFPFLALSVSHEGSPTLSFTRGGAPIPAERSPRKLFEKLFLQGKPEEVASKVEALRQGRSLLDFVGSQRKRLSHTLSQDDRQRMEQYFTSVRELEQRLHYSEAWEFKPKPLVQAQPPVDNNEPNKFALRTELMLGVVNLALQTDSTRFVTLFIDATAVHNITHHGNRPEAIDELRRYEESQFGVLNQFLTALSAAREEGQSLLDRTMVLYGTPMGSANSHSNINLPVLLAGGGFKHGQHLTFNSKNNYPLPRLFVSMLQRLGLETDEFSTGKGRMEGLEFA